MMRRPMKKPGSIVMAQKRLPNLSMQKMAGIVPSRTAIPPTRDMKTDCFASKPTCDIRMAMSY